jgi:hypothetical protein
VSDASAPLPAQLDGLVDDVARLAAAVAGRVAISLGVVALGAAAGGLVIWATLGTALLDEGGNRTWASLALAVACVIPVVLVMVNRRRLRVLSTRADELADDLRALLGSLRDQTAAVTRLGTLRAELSARRLGIRGFVDVGNAVRRWRRARRDTSERSTALVETFGLVGLTGIGVCFVSLVALAVAVPVALVAAAVVWTT